MRGVAALSVLVWHYQHFFFVHTNGLPGGFERHFQPFYGFLNLFYELGHTGVQFFFILSGAIFAYVYSDSISDQKISGKEFFIKRFARLYPLHFLTLLIVLVLQLIYFRSEGNFFVYPKNDFYHFFLNIFFISHWGFHEGFSFNAPVWSLSMEIIAYIVFFISMYLLSSKKLIHKLLFSFSIMVFLYLFLDLGLGHLSFPQIAQVLFCFFCGNFVFYVFSYFKNNKFLLILPILIGYILILIPGLSLKNIFENLMPLGLFFPFLIWAGLVLDHYRNNSWKNCVFIGDISYAMYLLHFPIQLVFIMVSRNFLNLDFYNPQMFIIFIFTIIFLSVIIHYTFENYARKTIVKKFLT